MFRLTSFLLISALLFFSQTFALAASDFQDLQGVMKNRKVIGVIYFKNDSIKLSQAQKAEIDRIASLIVSQYLPDYIVRVEGFSPDQPRPDDPLTVSLSRANTIWHYLEKMNSFNKDNLYLTGFTSQQTISTLEGERVEIAVYKNPFEETMEVFSSK